MVQFHINRETGTPGECKAAAGNCPFGGPENHFESIDDARQAFELSMAGRELRATSKRDAQHWGAWHISAEGAYLRRYGDTTGVIAQGTDELYLAYGKNYDENVGPESYVYEADAMASVAESFRQESYQPGDSLPVSIENDLFSVDSAHEAYRLQSVGSQTRLAVIRADNIRYFRNIRAVARDEAYDEIKNSLPHGASFSNPLRENELHSMENLEGIFVYIEHSGAVFRGELES